MPPPVQRFSLDEWLATFDVSLTQAFAVFDQQDSGYTSYGLATPDGQRWFVKTAGTEPSFQSFASAVRFHDTVAHGAIVRPTGVDTGRRALLSRWLEGTVLNHATVAGSDRTGLERFRRLEVPEIETAIGDVIAAHRTITESGFVAVDFYDGSMLYDFDARRMHLIDLDEYAPGPIVVDGDRMPGSRSYMAPEEWRRGATIDERTTVFTLGRMIDHLLTGTDGGWRGTGTARRIVDAATADDPNDRIPTVRDVADAWAGAVEGPLRRN